MVKVVNALGLERMGSGWEVFEVKTKVVRMSKVSGRGLVSRYPGWGLGFRAQGWGLGCF